MSIRTASLVVLVVELDETGCPKSGISPGLGGARQATPSYWFSTVRGFSIGPTSFG